MVKSKYFLVMAVLCKEASWGCIIILILDLNREKMRDKLRTIR